MTTVLLVRHATCDPVGRAIAGRAPGVLLNAEGRAQAEQLGAALASAPIAAVYSSPMERAAETAAAVAAPHRLSVAADDRLTEMDFGEWTGRTLDALAPEERWRHFNTFRSGTRPPGGELMLEAQARVVSTLLALRDVHDGRMVVAVTHGDVIKAALAFFLGAPLDLAHRMEIDPASRSVVELHAWGARVLGLNIPHSCAWGAGR